MEKPLSIHYFLNSLKGLTRLLRLKSMKINRIQLMDNKLYLVGGKQYKSNGKYITTKEFEQLSLIFREQGSATRKKMEYFLASNKISIYNKNPLLK